MSAATQTEFADPPSDAVSAVKFGPGSSSRLLVASWDRHVYLYDTAVEPSRALIQKYAHRAPVLDVCFGRDDSEAFSAGLDWDVKRIDLKSGEQTVQNSHTYGVRSVVFSRNLSLLISASWDKTLHVQLLSDDSAPLLVSVALPFKPFAMALNDDKLVVAMASRAVHIYELAALTEACRSHGTGALQRADATAAAVNVELEPWQRRESSLRFMTRAVACMPNNLGYASSSIEGRVAVEWFDPSAESQTRKYAFKCHRQQQPLQQPQQQQPPAAGADALEDVVYPVNALAFHPVHGTFASGGGDGVVALWDGVAKRRIKQYQRYSASVAALAFSGDGRLLAVAVCPGFEDGRDDVTAEGQTKLFLRRLGENEAKAKNTKSG